MRLTIKDLKIYLKPKPEKYSQKIAPLPIAPKFGKKEFNRFSQSPA